MPSPLPSPKLSTISAAPITGARADVGPATLPASGAEGGNLPSLPASSQPDPSWLLLLLALLGGVLLALTIGLWAHFGSTVFFEVVRTGWAACF